MQLYGAILSPFVARIALAARYKGVDLKLVMPDGGLKSDTFLALNPMGKIPTLKDGRTVIPESAAILEYVDAKMKKNPVVPRSPAAAAKARVIAEISNLYVQTPVLGLVRQTDPKTRDDAKVSQSKEDLKKGMGWLDQFVSPGPYATGAKFTIADCFAIPALFFVTRYIGKFREPNYLKQFQNVEKYWRAVQRDPMVKQVIKEMDVMLSEFTKAAAGGAAAKKKAPAKKTTTRKPAAKKPAAKKTTAKKTTARKPAAKKTTARKPAAKKTTTRKTTARKPAAKKTTARKTTAKKPAAKKTTARKTTAKKTTARKPAAKKTTARKTTAKKTTARKTTARKPAAKKTTARKTTARKPAAKKTTARKTTARKPAAKKTTARKPAAKKTTARKTTARKPAARKTAAKK